MSDRVLWCAPLLLGLMLICSALSRSKAATRWYGRLIVAIAGVYLLFVGVLHVFALH